MTSIRKCVGNLLIWIQSLSKFWFSLPIYKIDKNKIVIINFNGKGYGDNPKYIVEELIKEKLPLKIIWLVKNNEDTFPKEVTSISYRSVRAIKEIATAHVIITNVKNNLRLNKRANQIVIQTWHGSLSPKMLEKEAEGHLTQQYIKESKLNSKQTDLFLSNSHLLTNQIRESFWYDGEVLECGLPRNDILVNAGVVERSRIRKQLGIDDDCFVILYAPTFRDDGSLKAYSIDCKRVIDAFSNKGHSKIELWVRLHPNVPDNRTVFQYDKYIKDFTNYPDIQELLLATDILITDYSSSMFDISLLQKPVFIYAPDVLEYNNIRGLKKFFFELPFPISENNDELVEKINDFDKGKFIDDLNGFMKYYKNKDTGNAAIIVARRIKNIINE